MTNAELIKTIESNIFERFIAWIKSMFISEKKAEENSDELKREMCRKALKSGVCPYDCDRCAWNRRANDDNA